MHANGILSSFVSSLEWRRDWLHGPNQLLSDTFSPLTTQCQWTSHLFIFSFFFFLLGRTAKKQTQTQKIFLWWTFHWTSFSATIHDPPTWLGLGERMSQWGPEIDFCVKGVERGGAVRGADLCGHFFPHHRSPLAIFFFFLFLSHLTTTKSPPPTPQTVASRREKPGISPEKHHLLQHGGRKKALSEQEGARAYSVVFLILCRLTGAVSCETCNRYRRRVGQQKAVVPPPPLLNV